MVEHGNDAYTKLDDEDYLVLGYRPYGNTTYTWCTFYRQDWLEEAGFSEYPVGDNTKLLELYAKLVENGHQYPLSGKKVSGAGIDQTMVTEIILRMRPHGQPPVTTRSPLCPPRLRRDS